MSLVALYCVMRASAASLYSIYRRYDNAAVAIILCIGITEPPPGPCLPLDNPQNGAVDITGDVATYSCLPNYRLVGEAMRTCVDDEWSGDAPNCTLSK